MEQTRYLEELEKCVRCGSCKAVCPTYDGIPAEMMGARGRLVLLWGLFSGSLHPSRNLNEHIFSCILCGACRDLCPLGIDIKEIMYHGRAILKSSDKKRRYLRKFTKFAIRRPELSLRLLNSTQSLVFPYLKKKGLLPLHIEMQEPYKQKKVQVYRVSQKKGRVAIFSGCMVTSLYPHSEDSLINVLHILGYEVILPAGTMCCGIPLRTLGLEKEAIECAEKNFEVLSKLNVDAILCICPTCAVALREGYRKILGQGFDTVLDISSFLIDKLDPSHIALPSQKINAFYHDPCHLQYGLGVKKEPREIIESLGISVQDTKGDNCCGFGGVFSLSFRALSNSLLDKCHSKYANDEAKMVITSCPGCMLQISKRIEGKPVVHVIEVIEEALFQQ